MPINANRSQTVFVPTGNPDTYNDGSYVSPWTGGSVPHSAGELGDIFNSGDNVYQIMDLDSGCTAATPTGVVAANQLAFLKKGTTFTVTNDLRFSNRNSVVGIFRTAVTAGYRCCVLQAGTGISVKGTSGSVGDNLIANSGTAADTTSVAAGTAVTYTKVGVVTATTAGGNMTANITLSNLS